MINSNWSEFSRAITNLEVSKFCHWKIIFSIPSDNILASILPFFEKVRILLISCQILSLDNSFSKYELATITSLRCFSNCQLFPSICPKNRYALRILKASSLILFCGLPTQRIICFLMSLKPSCGS